MSKPKYDYSKVSRRRLEALARVCEPINVLENCDVAIEFCGVRKNVQDEARVKTKQELAVEIVGMLGSAHYQSLGCGTVIVNVKQGTESKLLGLMAEYTNRKDES